MRMFIKNLAKAYFNDHHHEFGEDAHFCDFLIVDGTTTKKNSYPADVYGYIMYATGKEIYSSSRMRVQYYQCRGDETKRLMVRWWFASDTAFYGHIWPGCSNDSTRDLVPKFCASSEHITSTSSMGALMFECDLGVQMWGYMCRLDYRHLALMARRIGQFHGRILEMRARNEHRLSRMLSTLAVPLQPCASLAIPTLQRCLQPLYTDPLLVEIPGFTAGLQRLAELVAQLDDRLTFKPQVVNPDYYIVCHRNYSQACGFFRYRGAKVVDLQIGYWGKVGWASLADDLVILLFVDADPKWQLKDRMKLVDDYVEALKSSLPNHWMPSSEDIWREIRHRIPTALYAMAVRVDGLRARARRSARMQVATRWDDKFVTDVYKLLILNYLV